MVLTSVSVVSALKQTIPFFYRDYFRSCEKCPHRVSNSGNFMAVLQPCVLFPVSSDMRAKFGTNWFIRSRAAG